MAMKPAKTTRAWIKNTTSSIKLVTTDIVSEVMPSFSGTVKSAAQVAGETRTFLSKNRTGMSQQAKAMERTPLGSKVRKLFKDAGNDIKDGNFAQRGLRDEVMSFGAEFDADNYEMPTDEQGASAGYGPSASVRAISDLGTAVANTNAATISSIESMTSTLANVTVKSNQALASSLENMNIAQSNILSNGMNQLIRQMEINNSYQEAILKFMNGNVSPTNQNIVSILPQIGDAINKLASAMGTVNKSNNNVSMSEKAMDKFFSTAYGLDFKQYKKHIKDNFEMTSVGSAFSMLKMMLDDGGMKAVPGRLMPMLAKGALKGVIGKENRALMKTLDEDLHKMLRHTLYGLGDYKSNGSKGGNVLEFLANILGVKRPGLNRQIDLSKAKKDEIIGWNGIAQKTLVEVIPGYLASMEAALTGKGKSHYNYETGRFATEKEIYKELTDNMTKAVIEANSTAIDKALQIASRRGMSPQATEKLLAKLNDLFNDRLDGKRSFNQDYKNTINGSLQAAGFSTQEQTAVVREIEEGLEKAIDSLNAITNKITSDSYSGMHYRSLMSGLNPDNRSYRNRVEGRRYNAFDTAGYLGPAGMINDDNFLDDFMKKFERTGRRQKGIAKFINYAINATRGISDQSYMGFSQGSAASSKQSEKQERAIFKNSKEAQEALHESIVKFRAGSMDIKQLETMRNRHNKAIVEGITSGDTTNALQSMILSLHTNFLAPVSEGIFGKHGLIGKFFGDDEDSLFNKLKEKLFGKEDGLLTPMVDWLKYKFTGKGYTDRKGNVYADTDDSVMNSMKRTYGKIFNNTMQYMFGEDFESNENYQKSLWFISPEAMAERKRAKKAARDYYRNNLAVDMAIAARNGESPEGHGFSQRDPRWAKLPMGRFRNNTLATMDLAGCGPTALAEVSQSMGKRYNPAQLAFFAANNGFVSDGGVTSSFFTKGARRLGLHGTPIGYGSIRNALMNGKKLIISGKDSRSNPLFSKSGHILSIDRLGPNDTVLVTDPNGGDSKFVPLSWLKNNGLAKIWAYDGAEGYGPGSKKALNWDRVEVDRWNARRQRMSSGTAYRFGRLNYMGGGTVSVALDPTNSDSPIISTNSSTSSSNVSKTNGKGSHSNSTSSASYNNPEGMNFELQVFFDSNSGINGSSSSFTDKIINLTNEIKSSISNIQTNLMAIRNQVAPEIINSSQYRTNISSHMDAANNAIANIMSHGGYANSHNNNKQVAFSNNYEALLAYNAISGALAEGTIDRQYVIDALKKAKTLNPKLQSLLESLTTTNTSKSSSYDAVTSTRFDGGFVNNEKIVHLTTDRVIINAADYQIPKDGAFIAVNSPIAASAESSVIHVGNPAENKMRTLSGANKGIAGISTSVSTSLENVTKAMNQIIELNASLEAEPEFAESSTSSSSSSDKGGLKISETIADGIEAVTEKIKEKGEAFADTTFGDQETYQKEYKSKIGKFISNIKKDSTKYLSGGIGGAIVGTLSGMSTGILPSLFLPGGPITGALAGIGVTMLSRSKKFTDFVFGEEKNGVRKDDGLISKHTQETFKKALPFAVGGGVIGILKNLVTGSTFQPHLGVLGNAFIGTGPIGAALVGAGIGILKNSESFKKLMFGTKGEDGIRNGGIFGKGLKASKEKVEKLTGYVKGGLKGVGIGAITGATLGHLGLFGSALTLGGPIGAAIAGLGLGIASNSERFKRMLFGTEDIDEKGNKHKNKDGLIHRFMAGIRTDVLYPLGTHLKQKMDDLTFWAAKNIVTPFKKAFGPIADTFLGIKDMISDTIKSGFEKITEGIGTALKTTLGVITNPFKKVAVTAGKMIMSSMTNGLRLSGMLLSAPLKMLGLTTASHRGRIEKDYRSNRKQILHTEEGLRMKHELEDQHGRYGKGIFGDFRRWVGHGLDKIGLGTWDSETDDILRREYASKAHENGMDTGRWFEADADLKVSKEEYIKRRAERRKFSEAEKVLSKWAKQDKHNETKLWTKSLLKERKRALASILGSDAEGINSEDDIKQLMYHRGAWQREHGEFGKGVQVEESPEVKEARINTAIYQDDVRAILDEHTDLLANIALAGNESFTKESLRIQEQRAAKRRLKTANDLKKLGIDYQDILLSDLSTDDILNLNTSQWRMYAESKEFATSNFVDKNGKKIGGFENYVRNHYSDIYADEIAMGQMPNTYDGYKKWIADGRSTDNMHIYNAFTNPMTNTTPRSSSTVAVGPSAEIVKELKNVATETKNLRVIATGGEDIADGNGEVKAAAAKTYVASEKANEIHNFFETLNDDSKRKELRDAEAQREKEEEAEAQSLGRESSETPAFATGWKGFFQKLGYRATHKKDGSVRGSGIVNKAKGLFNFFKNSTAAKLALGIGAWIFRDQITDGVNFLGNVITEYIPKYFPIVMDKIGSALGTASAWLIENVGNIASYTIQLIPGILQGTWSGLKTLGSTALNWLGFGSKDTRVAYAADSKLIDLETGKTASGLNLAKYGGTYLTDENGNYLALGDDQWIDQYGNIQTVSTGGASMRNIGRLAFNSLLDPRTAGRSMKLVGGAMRVVSAPGRLIPVARHAFKVTDNLGKGIYSAGKGLLKNASTDSNIFGFKTNTLSGVDNVIDAGRIRRQEKYLGALSNRADYFERKAMESTDPDKIAKYMSKSSKYKDKAGAYIAKNTSRYDSYLGKVEKYMDKASSAATDRQAARYSKKATKYIDKAADFAKKNVISDAPEQAIKKGADEATTFFKRNVKKLQQMGSKFKNSIGEGTFGKLVSKIAGALDGALAKISSSRLGYWFTKALGSVGKGLSKFIPYIGIVFAINDAIGGAVNAEYLFDVSEDRVDGTMRAVSAAINTILGLGIGPIIDIIFSIISEVGGTDYKKEIASWLYILLMSIAGKKAEAELNLREGQTEAEIELNNYNEINGTNLTMNEYNEVKKKNSGAWNHVKAFFTGKKLDNMDKYKATDDQLQKAGIYKFNAKTSGNSTVNYIINYNVDRQNALQANINKNNVTSDNVGYGMAQGDPRWAKYPLGKFKDGSTATMDLAGCGPTALANVATQLTGRNVSPVQIAGYAKRKGYITDGGANAGLFDFGASAWGLKGSRIPTSSIISRLNNGEKIIVSGKSSRITGYGNGSIFTPAGHIVTLEGAIGDNVMVSDPQTGLTTIESVSNLSSELTNAWSFKRGLGFGRGRMKSRILVGYGDGSVFNSSAMSSDGRIQYVHSILDDQNYNTYIPGFVGILSDSGLFSSDYTYRNAAWRHGGVDVSSKYFPKTNYFNQWIGKKGFFKKESSNILIEQMNRSGQMVPTIFNTSGDHGQIQNAMSYYISPMASDGYKLPADLNWIIYRQPYYDDNNNMQYYDVLINRHDFFKTVIGSDYKGSYTDPYNSYNVTSNSAEFKKRFANENQKLLEWMKQRTPINGRNIVDISKYYVNGIMPNIDGPLSERPENMKNFIQTINQQSKNGVHYLDTLENYFDTTSNYGAPIMTVQDLYNLNDTYPDYYKKSYLFRYIIDTLKANDDGTDKNYKRLYLSKDMLENVLHANEAQEIGDYLGIPLNFTQDPNNNLYSIINTLPYYSQLNEMWSNNKWKGQSTIGLSGGDIVSLASILTAFNSNDGSHIAISPSYILDWLSNEKNKHWADEYGFTDAMFGKEGFRTIKETYDFTGKPLQSNTLSNAPMALNAMQNSKLVLLTGRTGADSPFGNQGSTHTVVGIYSPDGNLFAINDPASVVNSSKLYTKDQLSKYFVSGRAFSNNDGSGLKLGEGDYTTLNNSTSQWTNIKNSNSDSPLGALASIFEGFVAMINNLIGSKLNNTEYKSIFSVDTVSGTRTDITDEESANINSTYLAKETELNVPFASNTGNRRYASLKSIVLDLIRTNQMTPENFKKYNISQDELKTLMADQTISFALRQQSMGNVPKLNSFTNNIGYGKGLKYKALYGFGGESDQIGGEDGRVTSMGEYVSEFTRIINKYTNSALGASGYENSGVEYPVTPTDAPPRSLLKQPSEIKAGEKTNLGLVEWVTAMHTLKARYVWGANCEIFTEDLKNRLIKAFGSSGEWNSAKYNNAFKLYKGRWVSDCSGMVAGYVGIDKTADGYYNSCSSTGTMSSFPKDIPGILVFQKNPNGGNNMVHVGISNGQGTVYDIYPHSGDNDVYQRSYKQGPWTHWGMCTGVMRYVDSKASYSNIKSIVNKMQETASVGNGYGARLPRGRYFGGESDPVRSLVGSLGGVITNRVGLSVDPFNGNLVRHRGTDIAARYNSPIKSPVSGTVVANRSANSGSDYGNHLVIRDRSGREHLLAHMAERSGYGPGSTVNAGDTIGHVGSTGRSSGPHVHYEVRNGNKLIDPLSFGEKEIGMSSKSGLNIAESAINKILANAPVGGEDDIVNIAHSIGGDEGTDDIVLVLREIKDLLSGWKSMDSESRNEILTTLSNAKAGNTNVSVSSNSTNVSSTKKASSSATVKDMPNRNIHNLIAARSR